jgi:hypothetical protein
VTEGYADYIARESSFPEVEGLELLTAGHSEPSESFEYFKWRKMVEHLVERRGMSFDEIATAGLDASQVESEVVTALRRQRIGQTDGET